MNPQVENIQEKKGVLTFTLKNANVSIAYNYFPFVAHIKKIYLIFWK